MLVISFSCTKKSAENNAQVSPAPAPGPRNSVDVVKASAMITNIKAGETADAVVQMTIQSGYHVNANPATFPYLKATELEVGETPGISVDFFVYPNPVTRSFAFAEKPLAVYEGITDIKVNLKAARSVRAGKQNLSAKLRVQACDEEVCYAPGTLDISIPLEIK